MRVILSQCARILCEIFKRSAATRFLLLYFLISTCVIDNRKMITNINKCGRPGIFAQEIVKGIYQYNLILRSNQRAVYTKLLTTKKKFKGLALDSGDGPQDCGVEELTRVANEIKKERARRRS